MQEQIREIEPCSGADKGDVAERALQRAIEEYRLPRPELVPTEFYLGHWKELLGSSSKKSSDKRNETATLIRSAP